MDSFIQGLQGRQPVKQPEVHLDGISDETKKILESFASLSSFLSIDTQPNFQALEFAISDLDGRFRVWSGNIGAYSKGKRSLDYRLRYSSHMHSQIQKLLRVLSATLFEAAAIITGARLPQDSRESDTQNADSSDVDSDSDSDDSEPRSEIESILNEISEIIRCLYRLSMSIRSSGGNRKYRKAEAAVDTSFYEPFDADFVRQKFPSAPDFLVKRLGKALSRRRQYFKYQELHAAKLAEIQVHGDVQSNALSETTATSLPEDSLSSKDSSGQEVDSKSVSSEISIGSLASETSYATTVDGTRLMSWPSLPKVANDGDHSECRFCHLIIEVTNTQSWRKHVVQDLRPYICTYEECITSTEMYESRGQWFRHELEAHRRSYACGRHCDMLFSSEDALLSHLKTTAPESVGSSQIPSLIQISARSNDKNATSPCPLCMAEITGITNIRKHIGRHLEEVALFALPRGREDSGGSEVGEDDIDCISVDSQEMESASGQENETKSPQRVSDSEDSRTNFAQRGILIVDDNTIDAEVLSRMLEIEGYEDVSVAKNGFRAVQMVELALRAKRTPRIIFMDIHMPVLDGLQCSRRLRQIQCPSPIIAYTALDENNIKQDMRDNGIQGILPKPVRWPTLIQVLKKYYSASKTFNQGDMKMVGELDTKSDSWKRECVFRFLDCNQEFDDHDKWVTHALSHFGEVGPPTTAHCPFCATTFATPDPTVNWKEQMAHVELHLRQGHLPTHAIPHFDLINYLWRQGLITSDQFYNLRQRRGSGSQSLGLPMNDYFENSTRGPAEMDNPVVEDVEEYAGRGSRERTRFDYGGELKKERWPKAVENDKTIELKIARNENERQSHRDLRTQNMELQRKRAELAPELLPNVDESRNMQEGVTGRSLVDEEDGILGVVMPERGKKTRRNVMYNVVDVPVGSNRIGADGRPNQGRSIDWPLSRGVRRTSLKREPKTERRSIWSLFPSSRRDSNPKRENEEDEAWTEITKDLVERQTLETYGAPFEETEWFFYVKKFVSDEELRRLIDQPTSIALGATGSSAYELPKDGGKKGIPSNARWTKIDRLLVDPEALEMGNERFEERDGYLIVLRVLSKEEIEAYAQNTLELREERRVKPQRSDALTSERLSLAYDQDRNSLKRLYSHPYDESVQYEPVRLPGRSEQRRIDPLVPMLLPEPALRSSDDDKYSSRSSTRRSRSFDRSSDLDLQRRVS